jgi:hypothetical protein
MRSAFLMFVVVLTHCSVYDEGLLGEPGGAGPSTDTSTGTSPTGATGQPPDTTSASATGGTGLDTSTSTMGTGSNGSAGSTDVGTSGDGGASGASPGSGGATGGGTAGAAGSPEDGGKGGAGSSDTSDGGSPDARVQHSVGGGCDSDLDCVSTLKCDLGFPRGMCTTTCDKNSDCFGNVCYMRKCYKSCAADAGICRSNYVCRTSGSDRYCSP